MNKEITIFIIDDEKNVRNAIALLMTSVGFTVKKFASPIDFFEEFEPSTLGCIISDIRMPIMSGLDMLKKLNNDYPLSHPPVILITGHGDIHMAVQAMKNGALDFIEKPFDNQNLLDKVNHSITTSIENIENNIKITSTKEKYSLLTEKEKQVFKLIVQGVTNKLIADELCVTQSTIEARRVKIVEKMDSKNLSVLVKMAIILNVLEI